MFTGIIKEVGRVEKIGKSSSLNKLAISSKVIYEEANISDSISVNGVCLTLVGKEKNLLKFDVIKSTLDKSNLKRLKLKDYLNLEPALQLKDRLGGHIVLGHIDSEVKIKRLIKHKEFWVIEIEVPAAFKQFVWENGSVALEGISLTIKKAIHNNLTFNIIPFTYQNTNLKYKRVSDWLNIEFDYLLKRV